LLSGGVLADQIETSINGLLKELSADYLKQNPNPAFKVGVAVLRISSDSPLAKKYEIGEAMRSIVESQLSKSLLFDLISRENVDKIVKELAFGMTGLVETSKLKTGKIREAEYFIDGSVTELSSEFKILLRLIKVDTATVISTAESSLTKSDIVSAVDDLSMAYVSKYGIGFELSISPYFTYILQNPMPERNARNEFVVLNTAVNYRTSRNFVWWFGVGIDGGMPELDHEDMQVLKNEIANMTIPTNWTYLETGYFRLRMALTPKIGAAYVLPLNTRFNFSFGASFQIPFLFDTQNYEWQYYTGTENGRINLQIPTWNILLAVAPQVKAQYFFSPRFSLQLSYSYRYQLPFGVGRNWDYIINSRIYNEHVSPDGIPELYNLKPWLDPRGKKIVNDLSGHLIEVGIGLYF
jgi:hypothetical protein